MHTITMSYHYNIGGIYSEEICDGKILCLKWKDKRVVNMLSTFHTDEIIDKRRRTRAAGSGIEVIKKPKMIDEYNTYMGGVDRSDQMVLYYGYSHRLVVNC